MTLPVILAISFVGSLILAGVIALVVKVVNKDKYKDSWDSFPRIF